MPVAIKMPDIGTTVEQVTILKWLKKEGQAVKRGEALCEIQTDKAVTELESVAQGVLLKQVAAENTDVTVGDVIAYVGAPGECAS
jgi:pyruvate/2-oxoglutarate dehydrogenase complex dihydrolipoamide acyltransferase (E2) component